MKLKSVYLIIIILALFIYGLSSMGVFQGYSEPGVPDYPAFLNLQENMIDAEEEQLNLVGENLQLQGNIEFYQNEMVTLIDEINNRQDLGGLLTKTMKSVGSPHDRVEEGQVQVIGNRIILNVDNVNKWYVLDTNSMIPIMNEGTTLLDGWYFNRYYLLIFNLALKISILLFCA